MALDVSTLVSYVIENQDLLVTKSLFSGRTSELIVSEGTVMTGVKFAEQINILDTDAIFQNGVGCTKVSSGNTAITQRKVVIGEIAVIEDICVKTLNKVYLSKALAKGSNNNVLPFEKEFSELKAGKVAQNLEIALWQGDINSGNANLSRFDGLIKLIDTSAAAVAANTGNILVATGITAANVKGIVDNMWLTLPTNVTGQEDIRIFCGWDTFNLYISAYTTANLFAFAPKGNEVAATNGEIIIPGTNYKLTAVHGLDGTSRLFGLRMSNLFEGTDLENEEEEFEMLPDQFKDFIRFKCYFKMGVNVAFPNEITSFKLN
jgi:hypothetical protein